MRIVKKRAGQFGATSLSDASKCCGQPRQGPCKACVRSTAAHNFAGSETASSQIAITSIHTRQAGPLTQADDLAHRHLYQVNHRSSVGRPLYCGIKTATFVDRLRQSHPREGLTRP